MKHLPPFVLVALVLILGLSTTLLILQAGLPAQAAPAACVAGPHTGVIATQEWCPQDNPHILTGDVTIGAGVTLTLQPGVMVQGSAGTRLYITGGYLEAIGTAANPITLTSAADSAPGQWEGLNLDSSGSAVLRHVILRYAGAFDNSTRASIRLNIGHLTLESSQVLSSAVAGQIDYGLFATNASSAVISDTLFSGIGDAAQDFGVYVNTETSLITVTDSVFHGSSGYPIRTPAANVHRLSSNTFSGNNPDRILIEGGQVTDGTHLTTQSSLQAYELNGVLRVSNNRTLTIDPGVMMMARSGGRIETSLSTLIAMGTPTQPITLTSATDSGPDEWAGLLLSQSQADLRHVVVRYTGQYNSWGYAAINLANGTTLYLENSQIRESRNAGVADFGVHLCCSNSRATISHTQFISLGNSTVDFGVFSDSTSDPITVTNSTFENLAGYPLRTTAANVHLLTGNTFSGNAVERVLVKGATAADGAHVTAQTGLQGYELEGRLIVATGRTLYLDPGVMLLARSGVDVRVNGYLGANGTAAQPITFTSSADSAQQQWGSLYVQEGSADLSYVTLRYGGQLVAGNLVGGALLLQSTGGTQQFVNLDHVTVRDNAYTSAAEATVGINGSHVTLTDSLITANGDSTADSTLALQAGVLTMTRSLIQSNQGTGLQVRGRANLTCGSIISNTQHGIEVMSSGQLTALGVDIYDNEAAGLTNTGSLTATATYNWWGAASGPGGVGPGTGDEVSTKVDYAPWLTQAGCAPDLIITKSGPAQAAAGELITYTLTITNQGASTATDLVISDTLPASAYYVGGGTLTGDIVRFEASSLAGMGGVLSVQFAVTATQSITNSLYEVSAAGGVSAIGVESVATHVTPACNLIDGLDFAFAPAVPHVGQTTAFTATITAGTSPITYTWNWGDATSDSTGQFASHSFPLLTTSASYTVTLTAANACGVALPASKLIVVQPYRLHLPLILK